MRILITQDTDWIKRNPGQQHHLAERLSLRGHEIRVIDYEILWRTEGKKELISKKQVFQNFSKIFPNSNVTVIRPRILKIPYLDYFSMFLTYRSEIKKQIAEFKPDIIIGHSIVTNYLSMRYAKKYDVPFIFHMTDAQHTIIPSKMLQTVGKSIEHKILQNADRVVVINELLKEYAVKMGADEDKVSIIKAGIESEKYDPSIENTDLKVKYGIDDKDFVLFFMGWLYNFSGLQEVTIELAKVKDKYSNLKLMIVGDGDAYDELKKLVDECELFDRVILTGKQPFDEIPKFISISTVCILPAHLNDTMRNIVPIKMYEYMAMKKPVIVTKLPGVIKEFGEDNGVTYVDKPEDVIEMALKLNLDEEGNKARDFVEGNDWETITDEFESILNGGVRIG